jgi:putative tricarboxylic transport membrane protein
MDVVFSNWRSMIGPKGLSDAQVAYWDHVIRGLIKTEDWKKDLDSNLWVNHYMNSRDSKVFLDQQYADIKDILTDLGLAK